MLLENMTVEHFVEGSNLVGFQSGAAILGRGQYFDEAISATSNERFTRRFSRGNPLEATFTTIQETKTLFFGPLLDGHCVVICDSMQQRFI